MLNIFFGWVLGLAGTLLLDLWRSRGKVSITPLHVWKRGAPDWNEAEQIVCEFSLRAINGLPSEKTLTVVKVEFHTISDGAGTPVFVDPFPTIGFENGPITDQDIPLPAKSVVRLRLVSASPHRPDDTTAKERILTVRFACVEFLIVPKTRLWQWFDLSAAVDLEDMKNNELIRAKYLRG